MKRFYWGGLVLLALWDCYAHAKAQTEGSIRPRRRHENDMDFSKYNPFYWEGRQAHFKVEDMTPDGDNRIRFTFFTEWPQDYIPTRGPDFSAVYIGSPNGGNENERSKFALNFRMNHVGDHKVFSAEIRPEDFAAYRNQLQVGKVLTFEFRFFMNEGFDSWQKQKQANVHNISAYYSEFFRIQIGSPGLLIDDPDRTDAVPSSLRYAGGATTIPTVRVEPWKALQQQAWNIRPEHSQSFMTGRTWFHTDMVDGQHLLDDSDDKPSPFFEDERQRRAGYAASAYNVRSCSSCHMNNGSMLLPGDHEAIHHTVVKTFDKNSGNPHARIGQQLQTAGPDREGTLVLDGRETRVIRLNDGTEVILKKPRFRLESSLADTEPSLSPRRPLAMMGLGLLEAIPETTLRDLAAKNKGTLRTFNGQVGRFGWKADKVSLIDQIAEALRSDMGVLSASRRTLDCASPCQNGKAWLPDQALTDMESYIALLGVPPRMRPLDPAVQRGEQIFDRLNCSSCHVKALKTGPSRFSELAHQPIQPFTDLLLHDMGPDLADGQPGSIGRMWRTAPLWGLKNKRHATDSHRADFPPGNTALRWHDAHRAADRNRVQWLHDGRADTIIEAILWHGGEASSSVAAYKALNANERTDLETFLFDL
ncbi:MAG TPA: di-heme oxidoredictase family protein [Oligoflexus sp.]|uniref:di-heme oxidoredictase family protein n=1 Tax=Oligoflexus sp. TaxID=1971216 RepID=UPI002D6E3A8F|nr:di-heme oxidoredictase family protein [Oligoflexus sp.]HYX33384.1 di-heme oxidoredictase family protein [Oligoflexus sp.]